MPAPLLTKSSFMHFKECPIRLWLEKVRPDVCVPEEGGVGLVAQQGREVDLLARGLYPGGVEIRSFNLEGFRDTQVAMSGGAKILFQPTAFASSLSARADILTLGADGKWNIHEVKMATSVKDDYYFDLAFQKICFELAGIPIGKTFLTHINNGYVRRGAIEVNELFIEEDVTDLVLGKIQAVEDLIPRAKEVLDWPQQLAAVHLAQCHDLVTCKYTGCWLNHFVYPIKEGIMRVLGPATAAAMLESGGVTLEGLSDEFLASIPYRAPEVLWPHRIDKDRIRADIEALEYPLYFFDYETYSSPIPPFDGYRPYQQVPFQYSLFVLSRDAESRRHDFLMRTFDDPALDLIADMRQEIGPSGNLVAWHASFEMGRNRELAEAHPEHADFLFGLNNRMYDLIRPFKQHAYVHPGFRGSASLKKVMPVLVPELSYDNLNIRKGDQASATWPVITDPTISEAEKEKLIADEIEYCRLDVYGMVRILEALKRDVESDKHPFAP
ncbi:MAG: DUF2779 domain-containing protein [Patescibacteria group bacterium]|nr:DUF2779 domain-containing protein [Patescibacteria group bacterium]